MPRIENNPVTVNQQPGASQPSQTPPNTPRQSRAEGPFDEDVFLPPSQPERMPLIPRPALEMASSADGRALSEIKTANEFQHWLMNQVHIWKSYLRDPAGGPERKFEFFSNAKDAMVRTSMDPQERAKALSAFKQAENLLDR